MSAIANANVNTTTMANVSTTARGLPQKLSHQEGTLKGKAQLN